ncbi:hypothetical protein GCM10026988_33320 [Vibrio panuliri]
MQVSKANFTNRETDREHHKDEENRILLKQEYDVNIHRGGSCIKPANTQFSEQRVKFDKL